MTVDESKVLVEISGTIQLAPEKEKWHERNEQERNVARNSNIHQTSQHKLFLLHTLTKSNGLRQ